MVLWLFNEHHIPPWEYYRQLPGSKVLMRAFYEKIIESRREL